MLEADGTYISAAMMLERFLFPPELQWVPISKLSGGEQRRLYLLRILMEAPNVLLLDEPTNDLDIPTLSVLEEYLDTFAGAVIAVSHDRYFLDRFARRIFAVETGGVLRQYPGGYSDYERSRQLEAMEQEEMKGSGEALQKNSQNKRNRQRRTGLPVPVTVQKENRLKRMERVKKKPKTNLPALRLVKKLNWKNWKKP